MFEALLFTGVCVASGAVGVGLSWLATSALDRLIRRRMIDRVNLLRSKRAHRRWQERRQSRLAGPTKPGRPVLAH